MNKNAIIYGLVFLFIISIAYGVPPVDTIFGGDIGLELQAPAYDYYPLEQNLELYVHIFNKSNGVPMYNRSNLEMDCYNLVYYPNGTELYNQEGTWLNDYIKLSLTDTSLPKRGVYSYIIYCNTSRLGGYTVKYFQATADGYPPSDDESITWIAALLIIPIVLAFLFVYWSNSISEESPMANPLGWFFKILALLMIFITYQGAHIMTNLSLKYGDISGMYSITVLGWVFWTLLGVLLIYFIYSIFMSFKHEKQWDWSKRFMK